MNGDGSETTTSSLPLGEILGASRDPQKYMRSSVGPLQKDALSMLGVGDLGVSENYNAALAALGRDVDPSKRAGARFFTYGKPVDWKLLLNQYLSPVMGTDQVLSAMHANEFDPHDFAEELVSGSTGSYISTH